MIRFACPSCGAKINVIDAAAGKTAPCPQCGEKLRVPGARLATGPTPVGVAGGTVDSPDASRVFGPDGIGVAPVRKPSAGIPPWTLFAVLALGLAIGGTAIYFFTRPAQPQEAGKPSPAPPVAVAPARHQPDARTT